MIMMIMTAVMYPNITLLETYCTKEEMFKQAPINKKAPVMTKTTGSTSGNLSQGTPQAGRALNITTAVELVGPKFNTEEPENSADITVATIAPYKPYSTGKPANSAYTIAWGKTSKATFKPEKTSGRKYSERYRKMSLEMGKTSSLVSRQNRKTLLNNLRI